jgi:TrmH family RNA methyltransferase
MSLGEPPGPTPLPSAPAGSSAPTIVLVRPQEEGNVGAAARAMANFALERLVLVEPATPLRGVARAFAVHAGGILDRVERVPDLRRALAGFGRVVATTAARDRPWPSRLLTPRELAAALAEDPPETPTAIVFGPEPSGLTNEELAQASLLVRIPAAPAQPTLNLAQAVLVVAYELYLARGPAGPLAPEPPLGREPHATGEDLAGFFDHLAATLRRVRFARDATIAGVERDLRQLVARAAPSRREISILRGVLRRVTHALDHARGRAERRPGGS